MNTVVVDSHVTIGKAPATIDHVAAIAAGARVEVAPEALSRVAHTHRLLAGIIDSGVPVYGVTTGVGALYNVQHEAADPRQVQLNMLRSHAASVGVPHDPECVRAIMAAMLVSLAQGYSATSPALLTALVDMLNADIVPVAPSQGSVGYLTATAHIALTVFGEGEVCYAKKKLPAADALRAAGLEPLVPGFRDGHALISGTYEITGIGALAAHRARQLVEIADLAGAMSLEALRGNLKGYDPRVHTLRPFAGQIETAQRVRALLHGSEIIAAYAQHRLQDALSIRCIPQVHGAVRDALEYVERAITTELNAVTDNPAFVLEGEDLVALPGGNGHGAPVALPLDTLAVALAQLSTMSQVRSDRLTNGNLSELPPFLVAGAAGTSGLMIPPYVAAAITAENRQLACPATVHTTPTCAGQEDHVSMGTTAAMQALQAAHNAQQIIAIELLCAAQALEFHRPLRPGAGTASAYSIIRERVAARTADTPVAPDIAAIVELMRADTFAQALSVSTLSPW